ncbi:hypothetical protein Acr_03g0013700 [Actinidia rufa]|uniref:Uncharacterized protein n=1 Tax=Actinidia rufa TaxID=165716 RepID=A0A7J0EEK4_9ERIC|nr:hypothetical protein Acr_03g0013700 [Actinidia rufa]
MEMDQHTNMVKKKMVEVPPRRGQIKSKMFGLLVKEAAIAVSVVGFGREGGSGSNGGDSGGLSSLTPPHSSYTLDGNSDF